MTWIEGLIHCYFIVGILSAFLSFQLQRHFGPISFILHGRMLTGSSLKETEFRWINYLASFQVPKRLFHHFYALGLLSAFWILSWNIENTQIAGGLLALQCFRRLIECFWVMPGGRNSSMHLTHYLIGISYYPILALSFCFQGHQNSKSSGTGWIVGFIIASVLQSYCHWKLGRSRREISSSRHPLHRPVPDFIFKFIHAPHYTAELLIYLCIAGVLGFGSLSLLNLMWTLTILGVSATNSATWMCTTWRYKSHRDFCKYIMIPFLF